MQLIVYRNFTLEQFFWFLFWLTNFWHTNKQSYGYSMIYNHLATDLQTAEKEKFNKLLRLERFWQFVFIALTTVALAYFMVINFRTPRKIRVLFFLICLLIFLIVMSICYFYPQKIRSKKMLINARLLLPAMTPFSMIIGLGLNLNHNIEYLGVYKSMVQSQRKKFLAGNFILFSILFFSLFVVISVFADQSWVLPSQIKEIYFTPFIVGLLKTIVMTGTTTHYFIDGYLFRFRDPLTRQYILPLIRPLYSKNA